MKSFDDFLKTLTEDEISEIMNECQEPLARKLRITLSIIMSSE